MARWFSRLLRATLCLLILVLLVAGPTGYYLYRTALLRNFHVVREGVLYRSGQLSREGLQHILHEYGIRTVISLREARETGAPPPDQAEEAYCREHFIRYYRLPPGAWSDGQGAVPAEASVRQFLEVMRDRRNYPVLIHCWSGIHRTGAFCAIYRMELEHWSNAQAIAEMVRLGYDAALLQEHADLRSYLENYRPSWRQASRPPTSQSDWSPATVRLSPTSGAAEQKPATDEPASPAAGQ